MPPVFAFVVQTFVEHADNVHKVLTVASCQPHGTRGNQGDDALVVRHLCELMHLRAARDDILTVGGRADLRFRIRVTVSHVLDSPKGTFEDHAVLCWWLLWLGLGWCCGLIIGVGSEEGIQPRRKMEDKVRGKTKAREG